MYRPRACPQFVLLSGLCACSSPSTVAIHQDASTAATDASVPAVTDSGAREVQVESSIEDAAPTVPDAPDHLSCDNLSWSPVPSSPAGAKIMGSGPNDIWVVANTGVMRGDGVAWAPVTFTPSTCTIGLTSTDLPPASGGLWVSGPNDVLVTGCGAPGGHANGDGNVHHWDGSQWLAYNLGDNREVTELWGSAPDDVWGTMLPQSGYLGHWDGSTWSHVGGNSGVIGGGARGDFWVAGPTLDHHALSGFDRTDTWDTVGG
jgi:hypothetical protein